MSKELGTPIDEFNSIIFDMLDSDEEYYYKDKIDLIKNELDKIDKLRQIIRGMSLGIHRKEIKQMEEIIGDK